MDNKVKFNEINNPKIKHFISCSDIYAVVFGCVYNSVNETYPTIEDIKHEYSKKVSEVVVEPIHGEKPIKR